MIFDVFQKGLIRGSEKLPYDPSKSYAYVEHPLEGWRVYLRSCIFLHPTYEPFHLKRFLVVKRRGGIVFLIKLEAFFLFSPFSFIVNLPF